MKIQSMFRAQSFEWILSLMLIDDIFAKEGETKTNSMKLKTQYEVKNVL